MMVIVCSSSLGCVIADHYQIKMNFHIDFSQFRQRTLV